MDWKDCIEVIANIAGVLSFIVTLIIKSDVKKIKISISQSIKGNKQNIKGSRNTQVGGNYDQRK